MIGLRKGDSILELLPGSSIRVEEKNDILNFDAIEPTYTWPFRLPTAPNSAVLGFPNQLSNNQNALRDFPDWELTLNGNTWRKGILSVESANDEFIEATFKARAGVLSQYKDRPIAELIDVTHTFPSSDPADLESYNSSLNSPVIFPVIHFWGHHTLYNNNFTGSLKGEYLLPVFRLKYILREIFKALGVEFHDYISSHDNDFSNMVIFHNRRLDTLYDIRANPGSVPPKVPLVPTTMKVQDYLPPISLGDLIKSVRILTCSVADMDSEKRVFKMMSFNRLIKQKPIDLSDKIQSEYEVQRPNVRAFKLQFDNNNSDQFFHTEQPTGNYRGEVANESDLVTVNSPQTDDYVFVKLENLYFKYIYDTIAKEHYWVTYQTPFHSNDVKDGESITSKLLPVHKSRYLDFFPVLGSTVLKQKKYSISSSGGSPAKVRISPIPSPATISEKIKLIEVSEDEQYSEQKWYDITEVNGSQGYIEINLDYVVDADTKVILRKTHDFYFPVVGGDVSYPEHGLENRDLGARVAVYHGMQEEISSNKLNAMMLSDPLNNKSTAVANHAIRFVQSRSIYGFVWRRMRSWMINTSLMVGELKLNAQDISEANLLKGVYLNIGAKCIFRKIKVSLQSNGSNLHNFEGYKG